VPITGNGFKAGDVFVTGSIGIGSESTGDDKTNSFNISPKVGYFLMENIAVGGALGYTSGKTESPGIPDVKTSEFSIGAFGRYYVTPASSFSIFGEVGVDYIHSKIEAATEDNSNAFRIGLAPGVNYFVSEHFALEAKFGILSYRTDKPDADGVEKTDSFNFGLNFTDINLGLIYRF
jgi:opacity protein-like surface antigen